MKKHLLKFIILFLIIPLFLAGCSLIPGSGPNIKAQQVVLEFWGVFDSEDAYKDIIAAYETSRPNIKINYKKLRWEEYERKLIEAWAEDRGPDIFLIHNRWVKKYETKIEPMPQKLQVPVIVTGGGAFNKKTKTEIKQITTPTIEQIKKGFVDVVWQDVVIDNKIWGLPLSVDSLALFYNRSLLDAAGIIEPPKTWSELTEAVKKITKIDTEGKIVRSAIAMGGAENIFRAFDILSLLMMQNGTLMIDPRGNVSFDEPSGYDRNYYPGEKALEFYTDFSQVFKEVYTWNKDMLPEAMDAFLQGKLAMLFDFSYQIPYLKAQGRHLNFGISQMPHINSDLTDAIPGQSVNLASYWLLTTAKKTQHKNEVWDFISFAATGNYQNEKAETIYQAESYLNNTQKPPALRSLLNKYKQNPELEPFVSQTLTAKNWYHGKDPIQAETIFEQMISDVVSGKSKIKDAIRYAVRAIQSTY